MKRALVAVMVGALALTACGTTEEPVSNDSRADTANSPVTYTDARGKTVTLQKPATKVVSLEWGETEMVLTLGVQPVGAADPKGYATWNTGAKLDASVKDVGTRGEPSVDSIAALQPDLIIMTNDTAQLAAQAEKIAPVLVTKGSDATRNIDRMRDDFAMIAAAVGKADEAKKVLADFDKTLEDGKKKIDAAGNAGKSFAIADGWKEGSTVNIRMFGQGALVSQLGIRLGLKNAWNGKVDEAWGLGQTDVEGVNVLKDTDLHFFYNASDGDDVFAQGLTGNAIWDSLSFVQKKQLHKMPNGIWTFGGPASCKQYIEQLVKVYAP